MLRSPAALSALALVGAVATSSSIAGADVQHVVAKGHTIEAIAARYGVPARSIIEANHLKDARRLKIGDVLTIPKVEPKKSHDDKTDKKDAAKGKAAKDKEGKADKSRPVTYAAKPKTPGVIHIKRVASTEEADLKITDRSGRVAPATLKALEKMLRAPSGATHPIDPRLASLLGVVSNHFGSRKIEVVSGFRPYTPTQYTAHSHHNDGKAIDLRIIGVPNEAVRDLCRTLKNVGCGYYPNSTFVHMDVRESSAFWIDYSKPGEPPRYHAPNVEADEGTSDVQSGEHPTANTPAPETYPPLPPPGDDGEQERPAPASEGTAPAPKPSDD
jgi:uncharacterized protein YcbK (DUF882 family)